jgi:hypothetical protein
MLTMFKRLASLVPTPASSKVTLFVSDTGIPSYKDDAGLVTPMSGQPIPAGYIDGFKMEYVSGTQIRFTSGSAYIPSLARAIAMASSVTKTPTLAANTWHHNYAYDNAGTPDVEVSTTAPATPYSGTARAKTGDTSRRYIGSFRTNAAGAIFKFVHFNGTVIYNEDTNAAPFLVVSAGTATVTTSVSAANIAPVTATAIKGTILNSATNAAYVRISNSDGPAASTGYITLASPNSVTVTDILLNASQAYTYAYDTAPTGSAYHRAFGYSYER